jgi:uncharacterized protein YcnI
LEKKMKAFGIALVLAVTLIAPVMAHVTIETQETAAGATFKAVLRVPHGCAGEATTGIRVRMPEGFNNVKPMPKPGWELQTLSGDYAKAYVSHGAEVTKGVVEISWSGGNLPDAYYDEFVFRGTVDGEIAADTVLYFPTIQNCGQAEEAWIDVTGAVDADKPAPTVTVTPAHAH